MSLKGRLDRLEARAPEPERDTASPLTPRGIRAAAQAIIRELKAGTAEPKLLRYVPMLLRLDLEPELKQELKVLWCSWKPGRNRPR